LIIPPLSAEDVPTEAEALRDELAAMLSVLPLASVLVEIDARTAFTGHLVHVGGKVNRPPELKRNLLYVIVAEVTNMGLTEMAAATGISYDALAWTAEWYFRAETLAAASTAIVDYHHQLPFARVFGTGTLASSDGQRFPVQGKLVTARHLSRYFARGAGVSAHTAVSDQHATLDTKVIPASAPEGHFVLDAIVGNTDPPILKHATDTHGASLANFALFDLAGVGLVVLATVLYGVAFNLAAPLEARYGALPVIWRAELVALVALAPLGIAAAPSSSFGWPSLLAVAALGCLGTAAAFAAFATLAGRAGPTRASVTVYFVPAVAITLGAAVGGEPLTAADLLGTALVLAGAYATSRGKPRPQHTPDPDHSPHARLRPAATDPAAP
jgi:hypothetical protein